MKATIKPTTLIFSATDNTYEVWVCAGISGTEGKKEIKITNQLFPLRADTTYEVELKEVIHPKYGLQFELVNNYSVLKDELDENIERSMLQFCTESPNITENILAEYPHFCSMILQGRANEIDYRKIYGVGIQRFNKYVDSVLQHYGNVKAYIQYKQYGYTTREIDTLMDIHKNINKLNKIIQEYYDRYIFDLGYDFSNADRRILEKHPELKDSKQRCRGLVGNLIKSHYCANSGSTCVSLPNVITYIIKEYPELKRHIQSVISDDFAVRYNNISLKSYYNQELIIATGIISRNKEQQWDIDWQKYTSTDTITLTETQSKLLQYVSAYGISILCGYAGTGKTASLNALIDMLEDNGLTYCLLAPTGIAAKKLSEATHRDASTIHRELGLKPSNDNGIVEFDSPQITEDICIIDETSMCGTYHLTAVFNAIASHTKVLLIGDNAQLASVSRGNVLNDLLEWGQIPTVFLTEVFRYGKGAISTVATDTRNEQQFLDTRGNPIYEGVDVEEYSFIPISAFTEGIESTIIRKFMELSATYGINNVAILTPYNKGRMGTKVLNKAVQTHIHPQISPDKFIMDKDNKWCIGDIVINTKNLYEIKPIDSLKSAPLYNGDMGRIVGIEDGALIIQFDNNVYEFDSNKRENLLLGYALTVHKVQGAQMKAIILCTMTEHMNLMSNNLLYVALTRAQKQIVHIGSVGVVNKCLSIHENQQRNTWLPLLLSENLNEATNNTTTISSGA